MKICLITPEFFPTWGGVGTYCIELVKAICDKVEVHVVTLLREGGNERYSIEEISNFFDGKINLHILTKAPVNDTFFYNSKLQIAVFRKLSKKIAVNRVDIIHSNFPAMPDLLYRLGWKKTLPSVTTVHTSIEMLRDGTKRSRKNIKDWEGSEKMTYLLTPFLYLCQKMYLSRSRNIIFVSDYVKNMVCSKYNLSSNINLIHMGVDTDEFSPKKSRELNDFFPRLSDVSPIVLFAGRLTALKGIYVLAKAMREIVLRNSEVHFVFAGSGNIDLSRIMKSEAIPNNRYSVLGNIDRKRLPSLFASSSIFVLPSFIESCPLSVLEAMSSEALVIASNVGGVPEIIDNEFNGILLPPGDHKRLAEKLLFFLENERCKKMIGRNARRKIKDSFTIEQMAGKTMRVYQDILDQNHEALYN